ncbi:hypothetical protein Pint_09923 [Pistacia integerrima]|uniref:Uncharacterized protein n=1 Tax=Pistacia integerrima TaxID=434235 RepID=A0ACC0XI66_9ROSI|nr:hypothetical protein Pint_09923 [Pistacia integerrima]
MLFLNTIKYRSYSFSNAFLLASMLYPFDPIGEHCFGFVESSFCISLLVVAFFLGCSVIFFNGTDAAGSPLICPAWRFSSHTAFHL